MRIFCSRHSSTAPKCLSSHPVGDSLEETLPVAETLGRKADPLAGPRARQADHVLLQSFQMGSGESSYHRYE